MDKVEDTNIKAKAAATKVSEASLRFLNGFSLCIRALLMLFFPCQVVEEAKEEAIVNSIKMVAKTKVDGNLNAQIIQNNSMEKTAKNMGCVFFLTAFKSFNLHYKSNLLFKELHSTPKNEMNRILLL